MATKTIKFNISEFVRVKLTEHGIKILREQFDELHQWMPSVFKEFQPPEQDAEGWSEWQLWKLMRAFGGDNMTQGSPNAFATDIEIIVKE